MCISSLFYIIADEYYIVWFHKFVHLPVYEGLCSFQVLVIANGGAMKSHAQST